MMGQSINGDLVGIVSGDGNKDNSGSAVISHAVQLHRYCSQHKACSWS